MKQKITVKPELKMKQAYNSQKEQSLKILSFNTTDLKQYLIKQAQTNPFLSYTTNDADAFLEYDQTQPSLYDQIHHELQFQNQSIPNDLCDYLISQLDSNGYFKTNTFQTTYSTSQIQQAIHILQRLEPVGCFCRTLKECLQIQCEMSPHPDSKIAMLLCEYLEELATNQINVILQNTNLSKEEILRGFQFIKTLNPKPAANFSQEAPTLIPEIKITYEDTFHFELLNQDFSLDFEDLNHVTQELRQLRNQAKQILNALQKRNITLLQIMDTLCHIQEDFFLHQGPIHYCTLEMVAKECGLHTSTISRAIAQKSFEYQNTYYPIKFLFSHTGNKEISSNSIQKRIQEIIQNEDKKHPYSDEAIRKILLKENIQISRRTVTKYREQLFLFNSNQRKSKN